MRNFKSEQVALLELKQKDENCLKILLGSMLGDGCVYFGAGHKTASYKETHCVKQKDYLVWKIEVFQGIKRLFKVHKNIKSRYESGSQYFFARTRANIIFSELRNKMYNESGKKGKKEFIPIDICREVDLLSLLVWYLDDGSIGWQKGKRYGQVSISCRGWNNFDLERLILSLNNRFGLNLYLNMITSSRKYGDSIRISAQDRDKLFPIWRQYAKDLNIPDCMNYKLIGDRERPNKINILVIEKEKEHKKEHSRQYYQNCEVLRNAIISV